MSVQPGTAVRSIDNPGREGVVTNTPPRNKPSGIHVQVRWSDGELDFVHEEEIEPLDNLDLQDPFELINQGRYGRAADLRQNLTYVHLSGRLANLVYAMGITNTDFYAHQYRPLLTLLDSPINGLLIADEVGLGKTIEAGLIWTELRARFDFRRLVVVCPAMLREKWRDELHNRFGIDAQISKSADLLDGLQQSRREVGEGKAWIISYHGARPPKGWRPDGRDTHIRRTASWQLADYLHSQAEEEPLVDLVVFDEAHYMRNSDTAAWKAGDLFRGVSDYQLMLSATPINLRNLDLFSLLKLLDPDHFEHKNDFFQLISDNKPLVVARDTILDTRSTATEILEQLEEARQHPSLGRSLQLASVLRDPPTDERLAMKGYRAELADTLERTNLLAHVVTRTRKKDVQESRIKREVRREAVAMSPEESQLYEAVTATTRAYAKSRDINDGFLLAMPQRQVTSCPAAIAQVWNRGAGSDEDMIDDLEEELENCLEGDESGDSTGRLKQLLMAVVPRVVDIDALRENDTKYQRLLEVAGEFLQENSDEKIIIFTTFRSTARYLVDRLQEDGHPSRLLWGGQSQAKQEVIDEFRKSKEQEILVSTEVASEGVDLQFCRVMVNYDLPWNPTRIEQRIGRIDRLGQKADIIHIWNLYFADTIDDRIVDRLMLRLRIFEEALGEAGAVVGEEIRKLESDLLSRPLTPEEESARIDAAAQALENLRIHMEELEHNAAHMMAHGQRVIEKIDAARELARRITDIDLYIYVQEYLNKNVPGHRFVQEGDDPFLINIQLPGERAARLDEYLRAEGMLGKTLLASGQPRRCRFLNRISEAPRQGEEIVHQFHPLIRYISADLKARNAHYYPLIAVRLGRDVEAAEGFDGVYVFYMRAWSFIGVREEEILAIAAVHIGGGEMLDDDQSDRLLQLARVEGDDWIAPEHELNGSIVSECMERAETELDSRYRKALEKKKNENADRAQFQLDSIERHLNRRLPTLRETKQKHEAKGRVPLARATQGKIDKLLARMNTRKERILEQKQVRAERRFICAGVIKAG